MHCSHPHNRLPETATDTLADARGAKGHTFAPPGVPNTFSRGES